MKKIILSLLAVAALISAKCSAAPHHLDYASSLGSLGSDLNEKLANIYKKLEAVPKK